MSAYLQLTSQAYPKALLVCHPHNMLLLATPYTAPIWRRGRDQTGLADKPVVVLPDLASCWCLAEAVMSNTNSSSHVLLVPSLADVHELYSHEYNNMISLIHATGTWTCLSCRCSRELTVRNYLDVCAKFSDSGECRSIQLCVHSDHWEERIFQEGCRFF